MLTDIISRMRLLEADHKPDGWPAVRMCEITALCNMIEEDRDKLEDGIVTDYGAHDGYALVDKSQLARFVAENSRLKQELANANREFDRVTGLMTVADTLP